MMNVSEIESFRNAFGTVTNKKVLLNYKSGTEEIPIAQISSVSYKHHDYLVSVVTYAIVYLIAIVQDINKMNELAVFKHLLVFTCLALLRLWLGPRNIVINMAGKNIKPLKVRWFKTKTGRQLVTAIKDSLT